MTRGNWLWRAFSRVLGVLMVLALALPAYADGTDAAGNLGDAPIIHGRDLELPSAPPDFEARDIGFAVFRYHPSSRHRVEPLLEKAEEVRRDLATRLGAPVLDRLQVFVARTPKEMATFAPKGAPFPGYAAGVAYSPLRLVLLTIDPLHPGSAHDLAEVFRHELAHVALFDAVHGQQVPRWFNEGFAVYASGESSLVRLQTLWTAALSDQLLSLEQMEQTFPEDPMEASVAYAEAADVLRFLVRTRERHRFVSMIEQVRMGRTFGEAMTNAYGVEPALLEIEWREDVAKRYTFWPVLVSGTSVWGLAMVLFVWAWRRKRRRAAQTLARWGREEAAEDRRALIALLETRDGQRVEVGRLVSVSRERAPMGSKPNPKRASVPKIEHDGNWHTLH